MPKTKSQGRDERALAGDDKDEIPRRCQEFIEKCGASEAVIREEALEDLKFYCGDQWPEDALEARKDLPCLVFNRLPASANQVIGDQLQNDIAVKIDPRDGGADKETAEIYEGLIRQIEYASKAKVARAHAFRHAVISGFPGYLRVMARYASDDAFEQELVIRAVQNSFSVYFDPHSKEPDYSDARECVITDMVPKDELERKHPDAGFSEVPGGTGDESPGQAGEELIRVAEYFWVEDEPRELVMTVDGRCFWRDEIGGEELAAIAATGEEPRVRKVVSRVVKWAKVTAGAILEGPKRLPIPYIPVVPVRAQEVMKGNERYTFGLIRWARDPQREHNYMRSQNVGVVALAPKAPFIGTPKMFQGFENFWASAHRMVRAFLPFNADPDMPGAKPERVQPPQAGGSIMQDSLQALDDMKATMGIPDARMGMRSNEQSGVAIKARRQQSETSTFVYQNNLADAVEQIGRILVAWIPSIYDSERVIRVRGADGSHKDVTINQVTGPDLIERDLSVGRYDVTVSVGPGFQSQREESREFMVQYLGVDPSAGPLIRDLIFQNSDFQGAPEISERMRRALPPGIIDDPAAAPPPPDPMAANAAVKAEADARKAMADAEMSELNKDKAHADVAAYAMDMAAGAPPPRPVPAGR